VHQGISFQSPTTFDVLSLHNVTIHTNFLLRAINSFPCKDASASISRCAVQLHASARNSCLLQNEFKGDASSFETQFEAVADKLIGDSAVELLSLCGLRKKDHSVFCRSRCGAATQAC
jgi:hypothetical protein